MGLQDFLFAGRKWERISVDIARHRTTSHDWNQTGA